MTIPVFKAAAATAAGDPIVFAVEDKAGTVEHFQVFRPVPAMPLLELAAAADSGDDRAAFAAFARFLAGCLGDQFGRFSAAAGRARLTADDLLPIVQLIVTEATGRPTTPPSVSPPPSQPAGQHSTAGAYWPAAHP